MIEKLCVESKQNNRPSALVAKKGTFSNYSLRTKKIFPRPMYREEALKIIVSEIGSSDIVIATTGVLSRELFEYREFREEGHEKDFLTVGGMGHTSQIALGIALQKKNRQVFCLDGDGSMIMHMGSLAINATNNADNFKHIVFNNNAHDSVGGQPTVAGEINLQKIVEGFGYKWCKLAETGQQIKRAIKEMRLINGPAFLEVQVKKGFRGDLGRPTRTPLDNKLDFMNFLDDD